MAKATSTTPKKRGSVTGTNNDKKELAKLLYTRNNLNQKEIAVRVGVTEKTLGVWIRDGAWEDFRKSLLVTKDEQLSFFYNQLDSLNKAIDARPEGFQFATSKEADVQSKLTASIKRLETETNVGQIIDVAKLFISWLSPNDLVQAKAITKLFDAFIKERLKRK